jgi:hypothetical protein
LRAAREFSTARSQLASTGRATTAGRTRGVMAIVA